jgi:hypothetical protein
MKDLTLIMQNPYLIQRAKFKDSDNNPSAKGIDKLLRFDYMGSAEFEFGALPKSLKRVRADIFKYVKFEYFFKNYSSNYKNSVTVFCKKEQKEFMPDILEQLAENKIRLKERCDLSQYLKEENGNDFWWDVDNDWFFWKINPIFAKNFQEELENN